MTRASKVMIVMVVAAGGLWGCAQGPASGAATAERLRALEAKCAKFEEDYRAVAAARDTAKKAVAALEQEKGQLQKELALKDAIVQERDELRKQFESRTGERDLLQARCERLKKGIQTLLGQDDAMINPPVGGPAIAAEPAPAPATPAAAPAAAPTSANATEAQAVGAGKL